MTDKQPLVLIGREVLERLCKNSGGKSAADARHEARLALDSQWMNTEEIANHAAQAHLESRGASNYSVDTYTISELKTSEFEISVRVQKVGAVTPESRLEDLLEDFREVSEQSDRRGRQASEFEERMGDLQVRNGKLERALAGMLFEFDDGVNGGHRESPDEHVAALDYARTLVKAEEFKA